MGGDNMHGTIHLCRTEENMQELVLFFYHVGTRNWFQVLRLGNKHLYSWRHLTGSKFVHMCTHIHRYHNTQVRSEDNVKSVLSFHLYMVFSHFVLLLWLTLIKIKSENKGFVRNVLPVNKQLITELKSGQELDAVTMGKHCLLAHCLAHAYLSFFNTV